MIETEPTKTCTKCGQEFPATTEYFHKGKHAGKYGLNNICKTCRNELRRKPPEPEMQDRYKTCTKCGETFPATTEHFQKEKRGKYGLMARCKQCMYEYSQQWKRDNPDKVKAQTKRDYYKHREKRNQRTRDYYKHNSERLIKLARKKQAENREVYLQKKREYRENNRDKIAEYDRKRRSNPENKEKDNLTRRRNGTSRLYASRRRARIRGLPNTFTAEQWQACLEYFNYCCAVCGNQLRDLFGNIEPHADHWTPLANPDCPGTVADNMVCLCSACNSSKNAKLPHVWLKEQFGSRKPNEILARIHAYFEWIRSQSTQ